MAKFISKRLRNVIYKPYISCNTPNDGVEIEKVVVNKDTEVILDITPEEITPEDISEKPVKSKKKNTKTKTDETNDK